MDSSITRIDSLEEHIECNPGEHIIFTGTFDPFHAGHVYMVEQSLVIRNVREDQNPVLIYPHNRTKHKNPVDIEARREWIESTLWVEGQDLPITENVAIVSDPSIVFDSEEWQRLRDKFGDRLIRVAGCDKRRHIEDPNAIIIPRIPILSSSEIRAIVRSLSLESLGDAYEQLMVAGVIEEVAKEIIEVGAYRK